MTLMGALYFAVGNINLRKRIRERDQYIESFLKGDTTIIRERTVKEPIFVLGNQEMKADEFVLYVNELRLGFMAALDSLYYYRHFYNTIHEEFDIQFLVEPSEDSTMLQYSLVYPRGADNLDSLWRSHFLLDEVRKKYDISIEESEGKYVIYSLKLDSALALFPYYRDRIKLSDDGKSWMIEVY